VVRTLPDHQWFQKSSIYYYDSQSAYAQ